ncbi:hypothetical protein SAMN03159353_10728 [Cedecea sp. NFIX57]|nr:hypothetical protein SAMN03159353_10728 [Cedecea sp. NFIX57]
MLHTNNPGFRGHFVSDEMVFPLLHGGSQYRHDGGNSINVERVRNHVKAEHYWN